MIPNDSIPTPEDFIHELGTLEMEAEELASGEITDANAEAVRDIIARGQALAKRIEAARKAAKEPHLEAGKAVDAEFKPALERAGEATKGVKSKLQSYLIAKQEVERKAAEEARKAAEALADDAVLSERAAEQAKEAEKRAEASGRVASHSGLARAASLRTVRRVVVTDYAALVAYYATDRGVCDAAEKAANAAVRSAKGADIQIPGCTIEEEKVLA